MEKWRRVWRVGLAPHLPPKGLLALRDALARDDARLVQGVVSIPRPLEAGRALSIQCACAIGFCGWQGDGRTTVGSVLDFFYRVCELADAEFNEEAACRYFLDWFDDTPRADMRRQLLAEVELALQSPLSLAA
jgi:hypothetical protein